MEAERPRAETKRAGESAKEAYDPAKPFNAQIRELIRATHPKDGPLVVRASGKRFSIERDARHAGYWAGLRELSSTDGIGTKGLLHWQMGTERNGAQDAFAMVADDLIERGFVPVMLQDHIMVPEEDGERIFAIVGALARLAAENAWKGPDGRSYPIIISGGETAVINTLRGFELGITGTGYVMKGSEIEADAKVGDSIIGIGSNGVHSNGLSFLREELFAKRGMALDHALPWGITVGEELTRPTHVYLPAIKEIIARASEGGRDINDSIHGMVHITGGGMSKLKELVRKGGKVDITVDRDHSLEPQELFRYAHDELGVSSDKMYVRFNNGVGYAVAVNRDFEQDALKILKRRFPADVIGRVVRGRGKVVIESQYEGKEVEYR